MAGYGPRVALDVVDAAAEVAVEHLGWERERAEREVREYRTWIERYTPKNSGITQPDRQILACVRRRHSTGQEQGRKEVNGHEAGRGAGEQG